MKLPMYFYKIITHIDIYFIMPAKSLKIGYNVIVQIIIN